VEKSSSLKSPSPPFYKVGNVRNSFSFCMSAHRSNLIESPGIAGVYLTELRHTVFLVSVNFEVDFDL